MTGPAPADPAADPLPVAVAGDGPGAEVLRAVPYAMRPGYRPLLLDLHRPAGTPSAGPAGDPLPLVVCLHGGGWRIGDRTWFCPTWRDWSPGPFARLVAAGFAVAAVDYRLSGEAGFPAPLDDVHAALAWLGARAGELGVDPGRTVLWGESAGGHLAALAGLGARRPADAPASVRVVGVVDWYGPADLTTMAAQARPDAVARADAPGSREALLLDGPVNADPAGARAASPVAHVHPGAPPFHLAHGRSDRFVPTAQSEEFARALTGAGVEVELDLVDGADHLWRGAPDPEAVLARALGFAQRASRRAW